MDIDVETFLVRIDGVPLGALTETTRGFWALVLAGDGIEPPS